MTQFDRGPQPDRFDCAAVQVALAWLPYGGLDEDVTYDAFGLAVVDFYRSLLKALDR